MPVSEKHGSAGQSEVAGLFERYGWRPALVPGLHDVGTDMWVAPCDTRGFELGLIIGVQVKSGPTAFNESRTPDDDDERQGWWFRDDLAHFEYWQTHNVPHLVVLYDIEQRVGYWAHITAETVAPTGATSKVFVPSDQVVDDTNLEELVEVAKSGAIGASWEGSIWTAGASIPQADHLRHALIVPRLIAPHPNAGSAIAITAEQAVALLMQARLRDLAQFAKRWPAVPTMKEAEHAEDWKWRFAAAMSKRVTDSDIEPLIASVRDAPSRETMAASGAAAASALIEADRPSEAIEMLTGLIDRDLCSPVDQNWLLIQRARAAAEIGLIEAALDDAGEARATRLLSPRDASAGAITAAAAALLFNMSEDRDLEKLFTSVDTVAGWWRSQITSRAFGASLEREFDSWTAERVTKVGFEDTSHNQLIAAQLAVGHTGDQAGWRNLSSMAALDDLVRLSRTADPKDVARRLDTLRRAGDEKSLQKALRHIINDGPAAAVALVADEIELEKSTLTTGRTNLKFIEIGGDLIEPEQATAMVHWILRTLDEPSSFAKRTAATYLLERQLVESLAGVIAAADTEAQRATIDCALRQPALSDAFDATPWARLVEAIPGSAWHPDDAPRLLERVSSDGYPLRGALLEVGAELGNEHARGLLANEAEAGSLDALGNSGDVRKLSSGVVAAQVKSLGAAVKQKIAEARSGVMTSGHDPAEALVLLNLWHPDLADWQSLIELIADNAVMAETKRGAVVLLANMADRIPGDVRDEIASTAVRLARSGGEVVSFAGGLGFNLTGESAYLAAALGAFTDDEAAETSLALLEGRSSERLWAAAIASAGTHPAYAGALVALSADADPEVRAVATVGLLRAAGRELDPIVVAGLRKCASDPGRTVALALARSLEQLLEANGDALALAAELSAVLSDNASALVRSRAAVVDSSL